jgi:hypothetical protein
VFLHDTGKETLRQYGSRGPQSLENADVPACVGMTAKGYEQFITKHTISKRKRLVFEIVIADCNTLFHCRNPGFRDSRDFFGDDYIICNN